MCVSFDQNYWKQREEASELKGEQGKGKSANFQYFIGTCMQKEGDAMFCFVGVRSHFGSKQLWSMV